jgi:Zn-dependent peptidase ImmA (M78 family)
MLELESSLMDTFQDIHSASDFLAKFWDDEVPVKVVSLARKSGVKVYKSSGLDSNTSGYCQIKKGEIRIVVNQTESLYRRRFTVAHELGHIALGHLQKEPKLFRSDTREIYSVQPVDRKEVEANRFAAELLMPEQYVVRYYKAQVVKDVEMLADLFQVSTTAMYYRLKNLGMMT